MVASQSRIEIRVGGRCRSCRVEFEIMESFRELIVVGAFRLNATNPILALVSDHVTICPQIAPRSSAVMYSNITRPSKESII